MSKSGGSVKETSYQKAEADVANSMWNDYQTNLKQYEDQFIGKVDDLNDESNYTKLAGDAATQTTSAFNNTQNKAAADLNSSGVDPTSGKYKATLGDIAKAQTTSQIDTTTKAQNSQQDKYTSGLSDVVAMGSGQQSDALSGYSSLAQESGNKAISDAETAYNNRAGTLTTLGQAAGMYAKYNTK